METNKVVGYSVLGVGGLIGAYMLWKYLQNGDIIDDDSVTWVFPSAGSWAKHLPDSFTGSVVLNDLTVPLALQSVQYFDIDTAEWLFWASGAPGCTLHTLESHKDYMVQVANAGEGWPLEWTIPLV